MALFEIVDEIAQRQIEKTETGDNRIYGLVLGKVSKITTRTCPEGYAYR